MSSNQQTMKIYSIISKIEAELEDSPQSKSSTGKNKNVRAVDIDVICDMLSDLKMTIPEDIRRATSIISNAETTIREAQAEANEIVENARQEAQEIVDQGQASAEEIYHKAEEEYEARIAESEIMNEAAVRAGEIMNEAETNANAIYNGAKTYADGILADLQRYLGEYHAMISANRKELAVATEEELPEQPVTEEDVVYDDRYPAEAFTEPDAGEQEYYDDNQYYDEGAEPQYDDDGFNPEEVVEPEEKKGGLFSKLSLLKKGKKTETKEDKPEKDKPKKGLIASLIQVDYTNDEEEDEDEDEEEEEKPVKGKKRK